MDYRVVFTYQDFDGKRPKGSWRVKATSSANAKKRVRQIFKQWKPKIISANRV